MLRADPTSGHRATGSDSKITGYYRPGTALDDKRSWGTGPLWEARPGIRMPVPIESTQFHNAGFDPVMCGSCAPKTMGGFFDAIGDVVGGIINWASGAGAKAERAAKAQAEADREAAEYAYRAALEQAQTERYVAELGVQAEREKSAQLQKMLLIGGGLGIAALVLVTAMKRKG